jgi:phage/plasmid primase-like uncharacterized protein
MIIASAGLGITFAFLTLISWYVITTERFRLDLRYRLTKFKLKLKFKRDEVTCVICGGKGTYPADGAFGKIQVECTRCDGDGFAYVYTYRFKWWTPSDSEGFHADQDLVEAVLGKSSEHVMTKEMAEATRER